MRILKNKWFARYMRRVGMEDIDLCRAAALANQGVVDADLGGGVIKQRIARPGEGKSGGFRTIVLFRVGEIAFFVYGFAKNERSNIQADELKAFKKLAAEMFAYDSTALTRAMEADALMEVHCDAIAASEEKMDVREAREEAGNEKSLQKQDHGGDPRNGG